MTETQDWAKRYRALRWSVIPVAPRAKRPLVAWEAYQRARPRADQVRRWLARWPGANLGVVTGAISGLVVLDIDPQHGGADSLRQLEATHGTVPLTVKCATGGGGRHLYFTHPGDAVPNRTGVAPGIDVRGDGGLVVVPPSIHPSGRPYAWVRSPIETPIATMPAWLLAFVRGETGLRRGHPLAHWRQLVRAGAAEGQRNSSIASLTGHLLWHGVDPDVILDLMLCWNVVRCRPPLSADEVAATVESIVRTHGRHRRDAEQG